MQNTIPMLCCLTCHPCVEGPALVYGFAFNNIMSESKKTNNTYNICFYRSKGWVTI